jgi:excisionase family DNA binding protein
MGIKEAAEALGVSYWTVLRHAISKKIPAAKVLGRWQVSKAWVTDQAAKLRKLQKS